MSERVDPRWLEQIRARVALGELIGAEVALKRAGREWRGLCPFHSERTPSFYVIEDKGFWHCFGCGAHGDCVGWVLRTRTADFRAAVEYLAARCGLSQSGPPLDPKPIVRRPAAELLAAKEKTRIAAGRAIWATARPLAGTPAARYLARDRHIRVTPPPTLRFGLVAHPFLPQARPYPALVGAIQGPDDDGRRQIVGAHCTLLPRAGEDGDGKGRAPAPAGWPPPFRPPGDRWNPKIMRGIARHAAVRLTPAVETMVIAEGIETALSLVQAHYDESARMPVSDGEPIGVWAALSLSNLGTVWLPPQVREVVIAADGDGRIPDAGSSHQDPEAILAAAAARHADLGRMVRIARPPAGMDFNDLLPAGAGAGAAGDEAEA